MTTAGTPRAIASSTAVELTVTSNAARSRCWAIGAVLDDEVGRQAAAELVAHTGVVEELAEAKASSCVCASPRRARTFTTTRRDGRRRAASTSQPSTRTRSSRAEGTFAWAAKTRSVRSSPDGASTPAAGTSARPCSDKNGSVVSPNPTGMPSSSAFARNSRTSRRLCSTMKATLPRKMIAFGSAGIVSPGNPLTSTGRSGARPVTGVTYVYERTAQREQHDVGPVPAEALLELVQFEECHVGRVERSTRRAPPAAAARSEPRASPERPAPPRHPAGRRDANAAPHFTYESESARTSEPRGLTGRAPDAASRGGASSPGKTRFTPSPIASSMTRMSRTR